MCLDNLIGVKNPCNPGATPPESGLYINDLPGITLNGAGDIRNTEQESAYNFLESLVSRSMTLMQSELADILRGSMKWLPITEANEVGRWDAEEYIASENVNKGVEICIRNSALSEIRVHRLRLLTNTTINGKQISIKSNGVVTNYSVDLVAGEVATLDINATFEDSIWVYWNTSDIAPNDSDYDRSTCKNCGERRAKALYLKNAIVRGKTDGDTQTNKSYGISVDFSVECSELRALCKLKNKLGQIALYRAGIEFMKEWIASDRLNTVALLRRDYAEDMLDPEIDHSFVSEYRKLTTVFANNSANMLKRMDGSCFQCRNFSTISPRI